MYTFENKTTTSGSIVLFFLGLFFIITGIVIVLNSLQVFAIVLIVSGLPLIINGSRLLISPGVSRVTLDSHHLSIYQGTDLVEFALSDVSGIAYSDAGDSTRLFVVMWCGELFEIPRSVLWGKENRFIADIKQGDYLSCYPLSVKDLKQAFLSNPPSLGQNAIQDSH